jgi:putative transposase
LLKQIAHEHPRWGFNKMMNTIKQQGYSWNHKRVHRIYVELGLNIRIKPRKRIPSREAVFLFQPIKPNVCWSIDFMSDALRWGDKFRTLNVIDDYNREALIIAACHSLPAQRVTDYLDEIALTRGYPDMIRVDNGPEFLSSHFNKWAQAHHILIHYIQPGKPAQNGFIERFNRTYREEVLDSYLFDSLQEVRRITQQWIVKYNQERPHESLGDQSPIHFAEARKIKTSINNNNIVRGDNH